MQLTVLGCRAGMPADGQASSGYLVSATGNQFLLDCGPGVATAISTRPKPFTLDGVIITHLHIDHCYDLLPLGKALLAPLLRYPGAGPAHDTGAARLPLVPLYVPSGARPMLDAWGALMTTPTLPLLDRVFDGAFDVREYEPGDSFTIGGTVVELVGLRHAKPNCGIRVTSAGASLAYTGDTGVTDALVRLAAGADLLLSEASLERTDRSEHGHLCAADAARAAAAAGAGELVLTHFPPSDEAWLNARLAEAAALFPGRVRAAYPGASFAVGR